MIFFLRLHSFAPLREMLQIKGFGKEIKSGKVKTLIGSDMGKSLFYSVFSAIQRKTIAHLLFSLSKEKPTVETAGANDCLLYE